jgi:hypothetical protein
MKKTPKKLVVSKQTVRTLGKSDLRIAAGGSAAAGYCQGSGGSNYTVYTHCVGDCMD